MKNFSGVFFSILILVFACSKSKDSDDGSDKKRVIDTKDFKNTASKDAFYEKGDSTRGLFGRLENVKKDFGVNGRRTNEAAGAIGFSALMDSEPNSYSYDKLENCELKRQAIDAYGNVVTEEKCQARKSNGEYMECDVETVQSNDGQTQRTISCASSSQSESLFGEQSGSKFQPKMENVDDCNGAFDSFDSLYTGAQSQFEQILAMLKNLEGAGLNGASLESTAPDEKSAVAFKFNDENIPNAKVKGNVSGGANDHLLVVNLNYASASSMDLGNFEDGVPHKGMKPGNTAVHTSQKIDGASDLSKKLIELVYDINIEQTGDNPMSLQSTGSIIISAGKQKWIESDFSLHSSQSGQKSTDINVKASAKLINAENILVNINAKDAGENTQFAFNVQKEADGTCKVSAAKSGN